MDLTKRLREHDYEWSPQDAKKLGAEAADEIERLREALKRIADYEGGPVDLIWLGMAEIARSALQQKDSE